MTAATMDLPGALRRWARGTYATEAVVELLLRAYGGRFAQRGCRWIVIDGADAWLDAEEITFAATAALSGGERRVLILAAALLEPRRVDLSDLLAGLDRPNLTLAMAAMSHAGGSHEHSAVTIIDDEGVCTVTPLDSLYPWPRH